jgi:hypothetical protein
MELLVFSINRERETEMCISEVTYVTLAKMIDDRKSFLKEKMFSVHQKPVLVASLQIHG